MKIEKIIERIQSYNKIHHDEYLDTAVALLKNQMNMYCGNCKYLLKPENTNRLFCKFHDDGTCRFEIFEDDFCSNFEVNSDY